MPESVALSDLSATLCGARGHSASPTLRSTVLHRRRGPCSSVVGERGLPVRTPAVLWVTTYRVKTERGPGSETGFAVSGPDAMVLALLAAPVVSADLSTGPVLGQGPCSIFGPTLEPRPRHPGTRLGAKQGQHGGRWHPKLRVCAHEVRG